MTGRFIQRKINKIHKRVADAMYQIRRWYVLKRVKSRDFTIISNNCWAGSVYRYFDMPYLSPTVGLYFFADDYLKFVSDLQHYLELELRFIPAKESRYAQELAMRNQLHVPVGVLDDIEVIFLHYPTEKEAKEKWERRVQRINWDNVFLKFSRMNNCSEEHIQQFLELPFCNKFVFNINKSTKYSSEFYWSGPQNDCEILADTRPFPGNVPLTHLLKKSSKKYPEEGFSKRSKKCF